jgi:phosphate/sulfate permease
VRLPLILDILVSDSIPFWPRFGMLCSLLGASLWVTIATYFELGCSTTHSIIGAVLAVSIVWGGPGAVVWADPVQGFPFYKVYPFIAACHVM